MALKYGFFNSVNGDRKYTAEDMMYPYKGIVSNGVIAHQDNSDGFQVQAKEDGLKVILKAGFGIFAGRWCENDSDMELTLNPAHVTLTRIDSVVLRVDTSIEERKMKVHILSTSPSEDPVPVNITRTNTITEYRLANIIVSPNATVITQADIEDTRGGAECGFVSNLLQNSDISAMFSQWQKQFNDFYLNARATFDALLQQFEDGLLEKLQDVSPVQQFAKAITIGEQDEKQNIPLDWDLYNSPTDILNVYINGMLLSIDIDYVLEEDISGKRIVLTRPVDAGTVIQFILLKTFGLKTDPVAIEAQWEGISE